MIDIITCYVCNNINHLLSYTSYIFISDVNTPQLSNKNIKKIFVVPKNTPTKTYTPVANIRQPRTVSPHVYHKTDTSDIVTVSMENNFAQPNRTLSHVYSYKINSKGEIISNKTSNYIPTKPSNKNMNNYPIGDLSTTSSTQIDQSFAEMASASKVIFPFQSQAKSAEQEPRFKFPHSKAIDMWSSPTKNSKTSAPSVKSEETNKEMKEVSPGILVSVQHHPLSPGGFPPIPSDTIVPPIDTSFLYPFQNKRIVTTTQSPKVSNNVKSNPAPSLLNSRPNMYTLSNSQPKLYDTTPPPAKPVTFSNTNVPSVSYNSPSSSVSLQSPPKTYSLKSQSFPHLGAPPTVTLSTVYKAVEDMQIKENMDSLETTTQAISTTTTTTTTTTTEAPPEETTPTVIVDNTNDKSPNVTKAIQSYNVSYLLPPHLTLKNFPNDPLKKHIVPINAYPTFPLDNPYVHPSDPYVLSQQYPPIPIHNYPIYSPESHPVVLPQQVIAPHPPYIANLDVKPTYYSRPNLPIKDIKGPQIFINNPYREPGHFPHLSSHRFQLPLQQKYDVPHQVSNYHPFHNQNDRQHPNYSSQLHYPNHFKDSPYQYHLGSHSTPPVESLSKDSKDFIPNSFSLNTKDVPPPKIDNFPSISSQNVPQPVKHNTRSTNVALNENNVPITIQHNLRPPTENIAPLKHESFQQPNTQDFQNSQFNSSNQKYTLSKPLDPPMQFPLDLSDHISLPPLIPPSHPPKGTHLQLPLEPRPDMPDTWPLSTDAPKPREDMDYVDSLESKEVSFILICINVLN